MADTWVKITETHDGDPLDKPVFVGPYTRRGALSVATRRSKSGQACVVLTGDERRAEEEEG